VRHAGIKSCPPPSEKTASDFRAVIGHARMVLLDILIVVRTMDSNII